MSELLIAGIVFFAVFVFVRHVRSQENTHLRKGEMAAYLDIPVEPRPSLLRALGNVVGMHVEEHTAERMLVRVVSEEETEKTVPIIFPPKNGLVTRHSLGSVHPAELYGKTFVYKGPLS